MARERENISMPVQLTTLQHADQPLSLELMLLAPTNAPAGSPVALAFRPWTGAKNRPSRLRGAGAACEKTGLELESTMTAVRRVTPFHQRNGDEFGECA